MDSPDEKEEKGPTSPSVGPPATGERADRQQTVPGVELPNAPELKEAPPEAEEAEAEKDAPDQGAAREREDDES